MKKQESIGQRLSPILTELDYMLWEFENKQPGIRPKFTIYGFRGAIKIFICALLDKMWDKQAKALIPQGKRQQQATEAGKAIRELVKKYTDIDSHDLYKI